MAIGTTVNTYPKPHGKGEGGSGGVTYIVGGSVGNSDMPTSINALSLNSERGKIDYLEGKSLSYNDGQFQYLSSINGSISNLQGNDLNYSTGRIDDLSSDSITTDKLSADEANIKKAWIDTINSKEITTEFLTVTKQAHFFELIVDKMRSVSGTTIETAANCIIDYVKAYDANNQIVILDPEKDDAATIAAKVATVKYYNVYWRTTDEYGREISNDWKKFDQALCQSFNNVHTGHNFNVSNKYYWRLVTNDDLFKVYNSTTQQYEHVPTYMNLDTGEETSSETTAAFNHVDINDIKLYCEHPQCPDAWKYDPDHQDPTQWPVVETKLTKGFVVTPQLGADWDQTSTDPDPLSGTMKTQDTTNGIIITPNPSASAYGNDTYTLLNAVPTKISFTSLVHLLDPQDARELPTRINIGIIYTDGTYEFFAAPLEPTDEYVRPLHATSTIKEIIIGNANKVNWHIVHGITLGNDNSNGKNEYDGPPSQDYTNKYSPSDIPSAGDHLAQLGYRYDAQGADPSDVARASAIIIAAYETPDKGTRETRPGYPGYQNRNAIKPPSYAQYVGINDFSLADFRQTYIDANGSAFIGNFYAGDGTNIIDMIDAGSADLYYLYVAYSHVDTGGPTNPDGTTWSKTTQAGVSWEFMGFSSQAIKFSDYPGMPEQQVIAAVEASLTFSDYEWNRMPGGTGTPGGHWVQCYRNTTSKTTAPNPPNVNNVPKTLNELPYDGWFEEPQPMSDGYYTWMSQAFVNGSGTYEQWQTPIRLTGADGHEGTDGNEIEFIYIRNNGDQDGDPLTPSTPTSVDTDAYIPTGWTDHPQGVSESNLYEYVSQRFKINGHWGNFSTPALWSNWGKKGQDGDGYEYIYTNDFNGAEPSAPPVGHGPGPNGIYPDDWPNNGTVDHQTDYNGTVWYDNPQGVSTSHQQEYVCTRKRENGEWGDYTTPALWAQWVPAGSAGRNGQWTQFIYKNANTVTTPSTSTASIPSGWSATATSPDFTADPPQYTWCTYRTISYDASNNPQYGAWQTPYRLTGDNGRPGEDGTKVEFIYKRTTSNSTPSTPTSVDRDDYVPSGWTDNPTGVNSTDQYEWVSTRDKTNETWSSFSTPAIWAKWGEKGQDGDGYEYIYTRNNGDQYGNTNPPLSPRHSDHSPFEEDWHGTWNGVTWTDEPMGVKQNMQYEYVATRKKENGVWGEYGPTYAALWSHWAAPGIQGPPGATGATGAPGTPGTPAVQYILVDQGSTAELAPSLDAQNNIVKRLSLNLRYKIVKITENQVRYLTRAEILNTTQWPNGLNAYCRLSNVTSESSPANYIYYKMSLTNDTDATFTYELPNSFPATTDKVIDDNKSITVALIAYNSSTIPSTSSNTQFTHDTQTLQVVMQSSAQFQVMQDVASISALVTGSTVVPDYIDPIGGQTTVVGQLSYINVRADGISSRVEEVNNRFSNYSTTTQTSNMIKQEVSSLNVGTKNYFNFTYCKFQSTAFPFIQGYGLEGYGSNMQVRNLDFQTNPVASTTETVKLAVRCEMRMRSLENNVLVGLCDMPPSNIGGDGKVRVTTTWQTFSFVYEVPNTTAKFLPDTANGHITFTPSTGSSSDNRLQVRNLMITKGDIPNDVNISWKDYESQMTREQALVVADDEWIYSQQYLREITEEPIFKGFKVYGRTSGNDLPVQTDLIYKNNLALKQGKIYTLSFYAKDVATYSEPYDNYTYDAYMHANGGCVNSNMGIVIDAKRIDTNYNVGQPSIGNNYDGVTKYMLNRGWQQFIIHWYNANSGNRNVIAMRSLVAQPYRMYIAGIELREGWWDVDGVNSTSLIKQTADEIELKVKNTGINIDDGTITLNADKTTINGNFELHSGDQGLKIYDANGNEKISVYPDNITGINASNYPEKVNYNAANRQVYNYSNGASTKYTEATAGLLNTTVNFMSINIGNVNTGGQVIIDDLIIYPTDNHNATAVLPQVNYTGSIKVAGNEIGSFSGTKTGIAQYDFGSITRTSQRTGPVTLSMTLTFSNGSKWLDYKMRIWSQTTASSLSKMGKDGSIFATDTDDFHWFGPTQSVISHGVSNTEPPIQLTVDNQGVWNQGADIGGYVKVVNVGATSVNATLKDTLFVVPNTNSSDVTINIPHQSNCVGKVYYFKNLSSRTVTVHAGQGGRIIPRDAKNVNTSSPLSRNIGNEMRMMIATTHGWLELY